MSLNSTPPTPPSPPPPPPHRRPLRLSPIRYYRQYWCYQCHQTVRILSLPNSDIFCPRCNGQFLQQIEFTRPRLVLDLSGIDRSPTSQFIEALSAALGPPIWRQPTDLGHRRIHPQSEVDPETLRGFRIILRTNGPTITPLEENPVPPPRANINDYFAGPGLHELIEELTQNDRPGPPPAPPSAIEAIPRVKITSTHMINESVCPVCKEEFEVGVEGASPADVEPLLPVMAFSFLVKWDLWLQESSRWWWLKKSGSQMLDPLKAIYVSSMSAMSRVGEALV